MKKVFQVGDRVTWSSSANGSTTTKTGVIASALRRAPGRKPHALAPLIGVSPPPAA